MPGFESIIDQQRPIRILAALLKNGTLPHALLFEGIEGVGKKTAAVALAMACNCLEKDSGSARKNQQIPREKAPNAPARTETISPCGSCTSCKKIKSGNHPDIIRIKPSGPFIKIGQVRALLETLALRPYEARTRVVIIENAQVLNPAAGNALLKILEEPPDRTMLILIALQALSLLPTIASRCQLIRFNPIAPKKLRDLLITEHGIEPDDAGALAILADGSLSRAMAMVEANWANRRKWILNEMHLLSTRSAGYLLALAERLSMDKKMLTDIFAIMKSWLRDLVISRYYPEKIINQDMRAEIQLASREQRVKSLILKLDAIQRTQNRIRANTNIRLTMETLLLKLAES